MRIKLFFFLCAVLIGPGLCHASGTTNASVYLGNGDSFTVCDSGATLYGSSGNDTVSIAADVSGVTLDQNVERINFSAASTTYAYKQTGNIINVYSLTGTLLASVPVQVDGDGTLLSFSDGMASAVLSGVVMTLGGITVSPTTATPLSPAVTPASQSPPGYTSAKIFLSTDDSFTVCNSGATVYGGSGYDTVTISAGVTGVTLDQSVEHLILAGALSSYTFMQTGNNINVYDATGVTLLVSVPVQEDSDGTLFSFSDVSASALLSSSGVMSLGGVTVSSTAPTTITLTVDTTAPTVTLTDPADLKTDVAINKKISATFSEAMDPLTITNVNFTLTDSVTAVSGTVAYSGVTAVFTPDSNLAYNTTYMATITTAAEDLAGNALASDYVWTFDTGTAPDTTAPTVTLTDPADFDTDVIISKKVQATFSEAMDPLTITNANFTLTDGVTPVSGTVTYVGLVATFTPTSDLSSNTTYTATITTAAEDLAGNALASDYVWTFTTVAVLPLGPAPVDPGTAGNFVLLTKTGITNTGATAITGDIGVSPIDSTAITGFGLVMDGSGEFSTTVGGPGSVIGKVYAANYAVPTPANLTTAISDMETAFVDAAGREIPDFTELGAGDISGMTLVPGLYKWGTGVLITGAGVTISGGADDVWIFQIAGNLTVNSGAIVTLAGGAQAKNIFWQVDGGVGVSFDTGSAFQGNILASKAIIFKTGATLTGRALAQTAVTLDANAITEP